MGNQILDPTVSCGALVKLDDGNLRACYQSTRRSLGRSFRKACWPNLSTSPPCAAYTMPETVALPLPGGLQISVLCQPSVFIHPGESFAGPIWTRNGYDSSNSWLRKRLNLPALKGGDSGGTTVAASRVVRPSELSSGLATAYPASNFPGFSRTTP